MEPATSYFLLGFVSTASWQELLLLFFNYSLFTVFCQFSAVQQGDPVTHTHRHPFFSHYHAPS